MLVDPLALASPVTDIAERLATPVAVELISALPAPTVMAMSRMPITLAVPVPEMSPREARAAPLVAAAVS
jgi:hypothetical protein